MVTRTTAYVTIAVLATAMILAATATNPPSSPLWRLPAATAAIAATAAAASKSCPPPKGAVVTRVPATVSKNVALTFDDGPSPSWTPQLLDILETNRVHATFFMVGENARAYPRLVRRVAAEGHAIGNHTYSHADMTGLSARRQGAQLDSTTRSISAAVRGGYKPCFFRPPFGVYNSTTVRLARARGMSTVKWSRDTRDWTSPSHPSRSFQRTVVSNATQLTAHPDILMHDGSEGNYRQNTVDSVQRIITFYKSRGYRFTDPVGR